ncbi:hypothetical protein PUMCH_005108 [Australozyma saopauloensis]|uniref:Vacuolar protein-sorting-associated protein 25 n=1 Tax=Australozyma saopauloensis TaxID=291208 RepID=A0AAX4HH21_9ASCO|nr:hypothetical protein PUMCH_005108 [[Candida] saopauloensis]
MFAFPKIHSFPPFYTQQQNSTVRENQLNEWGQLILAYCQHHRILTILPSGTAMATQEEAEIPPLFENKLIERSAAPEFRRSILNHLIHKLDRAQYVDPKQQDAGILIFWRTADEWARMLYEQIEKTGQTNSVLTVYELTQLDELAAGAEFRNMDYNMLARIVEVLVRQGKAQVLRSDDGLGRIEGVKML